LKANSDKAARNYSQLNLARVKIREALKELTMCRRRRLKANRHSTLMFQYGDAIVFAINKAVLSNKIGFCYCCSVYTALAMGNFLVRFCKTIIQSGNILCCFFPLSYRMDVMDLFGQERMN